MNKNKKNRLLTGAVIGLCFVLTSFTMTSAHAQEASDGRHSIYVFSNGFPPDKWAQYPSPAVKTAFFWEQFHQQVLGSQNLALTDQPDTADYIVELQCGGIRNCSKLIVNIKSPSRDLLGSFKLSKISGLFHSPRLEHVAKRLSSTLDKHILAIENGEFRHTEE